METTHTAHREPDLADATEADLRDAARVRALAHVFAAANHDLKTPLNAIALHLDLLADALPRLATDAPAPLDRHRRNLGLMTAEIDRLKQMFAALTGLVTARHRDPVDIDLAALAAEFAGILKPLAMRYRVELVAGDQAAAHVHGSPDLIIQALLHIALNAFEAMPTGGRLTLSLRADRDHAVVSITDTGPGIPLAVLPHIFDLRYTTKPHAAGLGLHVARNIIEDHGGSITVDAPPGAGATFTVTLPISTG